MTNEAPTWPSRLAPFFAQGGERAAELPHAWQEKPYDELQLLVLTAAGARLAIDILQVAEVAKGPPLTFVPRTPTWHLGIAAIRGTLMPIVSLAALLQASAPARRAAGESAGPGPNEADVLGTPSRVVVVRHAAPLGLAVDAVLNVVRLAPDALLPAGDEASPAVPWALGFAPLARGLTAVLAVDALERSLRLLPAVRATRG